LTFAILEGGDGATLQLVYGGTPDAPVTIDGTVLGARVLRVRRPLEDNEHNTSDTKFESKLHVAIKATALLYLFMPLMLFAISGDAMKRIFRNRSDTGHPEDGSPRFDRLIRSRKFWFLQTVWTLLILGAYYYLFYSYPEVPSSLLS
jgi:hypothetical protein